MDELRHGGCRHAATAAAFGHGVLAEDLPDLLSKVFRDLAVEAI